MPESQEQKAPEDFLEQLKKKAEETLLSWGPPGLGLGVTIHFARNAQWGEAFLAIVLTGFVTFLIKFFNKLDPRLDKLAEWLASSTENVVLQLWWQFTSQFQGRYYKSLVYAYRDFRTQGLKTRGPFALDLEKVFVPLRVAPESVDRISTAMVQSKQPTGSLDIWDVLAAIPRQSASQRIVVIGPPGSGKSTLLEHLTLTYARQNQRQQHRQAPRLIPVLLYLRNVRQIITSEHPPNLATLIEQQDLIQTLKPHTQWFETQLQNGHCLVMLDGLDEVADEEQRQSVSRWVDRQMRAYPRTPFILTSRPFGYRNAELNEVRTVLEIQPFNLQQMQQFINNWYLQNELMRRLGKDDPGVRETARKQADDLVDRIKNAPSLAAMAFNPLLLTMIATVHCFRGALPGRRVELYAEICDVLLGRRQDAKGMPDRLTAAQKKLILQGLALKLMEKKTREVKAIAGLIIISKKLTNVSGDAADPVQFLKQIENVSGLLVERQPGIYEFAHKSLQEYLAAVQIKELNKEYLLVRNIDDSWWDETIRLYAAQTEATNLIWAALDKPTVVSLTLAHDCLEEGLSVQPDVRKQLEDTLEAGLESTEPDIFKLAAEVKLSRRLDRLIRIDDSIDIDTSYLSCAEYQLFIDEKRQIGEYRQPDHWSSDRFDPGNAATPITGIRASDAEEFCHWLTQRLSPLGDTYLEGKVSVFVGSSKFRLPHLSEIQDHPSLESSIGTWCTDGDRSWVGDIPQTQWNVWRDQLARSFDADPALDRARELELKFALELARGRDPDRSRSFELARTHIRELARTRPLNLALDRDRAQIYKPVFVRASDQVFAPAFNRAFDEVIALDRMLNRDLLKHQAVDQDAAFVGIRSHILFISTIWAALADYYQTIARNRGSLRSQQLTRNECDKLNQQYAADRDAAIDIYNFFLLLDERRKGQMPAWESIRLARERFV